MIAPNKGRIIVELIKRNEGQIFLPTRQNVRAGENAYVGKVVHAGESQFKKDQLVLFADYSIVGFYHDPEKIVSGEVSDSEATKPENMHYIIAEDDIIAYG